MATKAKSKKRPPRKRCYPAEFKVRAVKLHLEEGYATSMVAARSSAASAPTSMTGMREASI